MEAEKGLRSVDSNALIEGLNMMKSMMKIKQTWGNNKHLVWGTLSVAISPLPIILL